MLKKSYIYTLLALTLFTTCGREEVSLTEEAGNGKKLVLKYRIEQFGPTPEPVVHSDHYININTLYVLFLNTVQTEAANW
ncbi:MAG: hypothetical protein LUE98_20595 [Tannerellaceae bacterium]|nr:hypothetical protein [Tannerellaceae bacterium]